MVTLLTERRDFVTLDRFGGKGGAEHYYNTVVVNGNATIENTVDAPFKPWHVGMFVALAGIPLATNTVVSAYISPTQVTISNVPGVGGTTRVLLFWDDTTPLAQALAYATKRGKAVILDSKFVVQPTLLAKRSALLGAGRSTSELFLRPGFAAGASKFLLKNSNVADHHQCIEDITLNGLRDFQRDGGNVILYDINVLEFAGQAGVTEVTDVYNIYRNLEVREAGNACIKYSGRGESLFEGINIERGSYGLDLNSFDNRVVGVNATAYGTAFYLGSSVGSCRFDNCKGFYSGYSPKPGAVGAGETCNWYLNGSSRNDFVACEGQEAWGCNWVLNGAKCNSFASVRGADPGCIFPAHGEGADNSGVTRAGFWLYGASDDNSFAAVKVSVGVHGVTSYGTHAVLVDGTSANNVGRIDVDKLASGWATAKIGRPTSGTGNTLRVDGEMISNDKYAVPFDAWAFAPQITNGPSTGEIELATNKQMLRTLDFDKTIQEYAQVRIPLPPSVDPSSFTYRWRWSHATAAGSYGATLSVEARATSNDEAIDGAWGTAVLVNDVGGTADRDYISPESTAVTPGNTPVAGDTLWVRVSRAVADGGDVLDTDLRLHNLDFFFNYKKENDA
jgi:hypothetical protein